jgi:hypothetical protein
VVHLLVREMTNGEWKTAIALINADPATAQLKADIERACWRYLTHVRGRGIGCALKVVVDPIGGGDVPQ